MLGKAYCKGGFFMKNQKTPVAIILSAILSFAVFLMLQLFLAAFAVRGVFPEKYLFYIQMLFCGLAALCGGRICTRRVGHGPLRVSLMVSAGLMLLLALVGLMIYNSVNWSGGGWKLLLSALGGGFLSGITGVGKRGGKKKRTIVSRNHKP
jgi:putative membrane protein (TIGR04086 family)